MLPNFAVGEDFAPLAVNKISCGRDATLRGAFSRSEKPLLSLELPRTIGCICPVMRISRDAMAPGEEKAEPFRADIPFAYSKTEYGCAAPYDVYTLTLDADLLCGNTGSGLFYWEIIFMRGLDTLFSDTVDNVHFTLSRTNGHPFRLLIYEDGYAVPDVGGGIMYHVFVDRFARGKGHTEYMPDARVSACPPDKWEPEYAEIRGGDVDNRDFFGGNLWGVAEKMPYLSSLGVTMLYLSPVGKSPSNHKYDTWDYMQTDGGFGGDEALAKVFSEGKKYGIKVILDGVYNHTGNDSPYFVSAQDENSPYRSWYYFSDAAAGGHGYECWWGIKILPKLNLSDGGCMNYLTSADGVAGKYMKMGASGFRLDVADELPDEFLENLRATVKKINPEGIIIGEVWENAADKIAYGRRRSYFRGNQLDSVMNYPFRSAVIDFVRYGDSRLLADELTEIYASYPRSVCDVLMNVIGTHDTERILTLLGAPERASDASASNDNCVQAEFALTAVERA